MQSIDIDRGIQIVFDALMADRLCVLLGAGLSMAPPSCLPSAAALALGARQKYNALHGLSRPPLAEGIEEQAEFFFRKGELATVYFRNLVDFHAFAGQPNEGHEAVADLLLVRGIQAAVTTNVDMLVETAGQQLFGQIGVGVSGTECAALPPGHSPLLKIYGCRSRDPDNMVWAPGQLGKEPVAGRITASRNWLRMKLLDRDLLIVGFWTDWDYLNDVLEHALGEVRPSRVVVVDPADGANFGTKAPVLYQLGERTNAPFYHVRSSGANFLAQLRRDFSKSFIRQVLHSGRDEFAQEIGTPPAAEMLEPPPLDNEPLWRMRRDLEGRQPNQPAQETVPPMEPLLGLTILKLRAAGAAQEGAYWLLQDRRIRVLRTPNQPLHRVEAAFKRELAPAIAPDIVIAVGAEGQSLPPDIVRGGSTPTIARGNSSRWFTRSDAMLELGI